MISLHWRVILGWESLCKMHFEQWGGIYHEVPSVSGDVIPWRANLQGEAGILFNFHLRNPAGCPGNWILKWVCSPRVLLCIWEYTSSPALKCSKVSNCSVLFSMSVFQSTCRAHHVLVSIRLPVTDRDDYNYMLSVASLQYRNRFMIHQPTQCPHMHRRALTHIQREATQTNSRTPP